MIGANIQIAKITFFDLFFVFNKACHSESILITKEEYNQQSILPRGPGPNTPSQHHKDCSVRITTGLETVTWGNENCKHDQQGDTFPVLNTHCYYC